MMATDSAKNRHEEQHAFQTHAQSRLHDQLGERRCEGRWPTQPGTSTFLRISSTWFWPCVANTGVRKAATDRVIVDAASGSRESDDCIGDEQRRGPKLT